MLGRFIVGLPIGARLRVRPGPTLQPKGRHPSAEFTLSYAEGRRADTQVCPYVLAVTEGNPPNPLFVKVGWGDFNLPRGDCRG